MLALEKGRFSPARSRCAAGRTIRTYDQDAIYCARTNLRVILSADASATQSGFSNIDNDPARTERIRAVRQLFEAFLIAVIVALSLRRAAFLVATLLRPRPLPRPAATFDVTVVVPARNERAVADRLLRALSRLDYPADRLSFVFVCDGCVDETPTLFREWAGQRDRTRVLELPRNVGKAAALNAGLAVVDTEIVAILDADLQPLPDYLRELLRPFADERVAAAAAYLRPANADANVVSRYAAITTWVHQLVTSAGTDRLGLNPPTLGAAAYRRSALQQIGGFAQLPAGEDVATSSRLTSRGWRTRFVGSAVADNMVASTVHDFWRQHVRWSRAVFRAHSDRQVSTASFAQRVETAASSIGYSDRFVVALATAAAVAGAVPAWIPGLYFVVPGLEIVAALLNAGVRWRLPSFVLAAIVVFPADLAGAVASVTLHVARRPLRWQSPRWSHVDGDASG